MIRYGNSKVLLWDRPVTGVKNCKLYVLFDRMYVRYGIICLICNKIKFITNFTHVTRIHIFAFTTINTHFPLLIQTLP
jgi:hypothetical protein